MRRPAQRTFESELFGYEEGPILGQTGRKTGKFEMANKGVLFLTITNMPLDMQAKLLRVLQERQAVRIGGSDPIAFDVQVIAATNKDMISEIERKNFRLDLFYRLNIIHIKIPALKERKDDIDLFIRYFMNKFNPKGDMRIHPDAIQILRKYDWPECTPAENVTERMVIIAILRSRQGMHSG
ncbi:MAG: sigma 54-interacting transcriptional regulator [Dysosmobacter welbionis]